MRIGFDATPLLGAMTGVGTYAANLLAALAAGYPDDDLVATAFSLRGRGDLGAVVPEGVAVRARPYPARALRLAWGAADLPAVESLCGPVDVFHATNFVLPPTRRAAGVLTIHDLAYLSFPETVSRESLAYRELVPRGIARAAMVVTPSAAVAEQVQDAYRLPADRVAVTPLGVDAAWHRSAPPSGDWLAARGLPTEYLLAVGTLEPRKNLRRLVDAYRILSASDAATPPLVVAGGAGWGDALDEAARSHVHLTGRLELDELRTLVAGAAALVFPSLDEGFGLPPLEALACGVPVVANDLPVTREVLGDQALFCDATDPEALAAAVVQVLSAPAGDVDSRRARAASFTWARCAEATHTAYRRALG